MNREEFESLRNLPDKEIKSDVRFTKSKNLSPLLVADVRIENTAGITLILNINVNPKTNAKTFNVVKGGNGPICRLDVDGPAHRPAGRSHKHSVHTPECSDRNLPIVADMPDLSGKPARELFDKFCSMASITFSGTFEEPDTTKVAP